MPSVVSAMRSSRDQEPGIKDRLQIRTIGTFHGPSAREHAPLRPSLLPVAAEVDDVAAVAEAVRQLARVHERRPREVRLPALHAVELRRVADRLVDLQSELIAAEDDVDLADRTLIRREQRDRFVPDA